MWICNPNELFSFDIVPEEGDSTSDIINKVSRMLIIIILIMLYFSYSFEMICKVFAIGIIIILFLYSWITNKKEKFSSINNKMNHPVFESSQNVIHQSNSEQSSQQDSQQVEPLQQVQQVQQQVQQQQVQQQVQQQQVQQVQQQQVQQVQQQVQHQVQQHKVQQVQQQQVQHQVQQQLQKQVQQQVQQQLKQHSQISELDEEEQLHNKIKNSITLLSELLNKKTEEKRETFQGYKIQRQSEPKNRDDYYTPQMGENLRMRRETVILPPRIMDPEFQNSKTNFPVNKNPLQDFGGMRLQDFGMKSKEKYGMLLEATENEEPISISKPNRIFLQDVQPNVYSYTNDRTPINSNIGISSTPQIPPLSKKTIRGDDGKVYPLYSRIDPELVRDEVDPERLEEMPKRTEWSEELPASNPLNESNVYDPRFTGYGDDARAFYDSNLGQIRYYYTDVDAYRSPNFIIRNKVDHVDFQEPMGKTYSMYPRTASLEDVHEQVNNDWMAKSTEFREDIMEKLMRKNNSMNWQMRFAPKSKGSNLSSFSSRY